jgi:uncharacterized membrane protein YraQ (UPF0718 family)
MERQRRNTGLGGWLFLLLVVVAYSATAVVDAETACQALSFFSKVIYKVLPILVTVFFLLLAADLLFGQKWIKRNLGREAGIKGWFLAVIGGVLAAGPVYTWYALLRELREKGMRASLAAAFLFSRAIKLPLLPLMVHYFGIAYTLVLCLYLLGFSVVGGVLMRRFDDRETGQD